MSHRKDIRKIIFAFWILMLGFFLIGCARTITQKVTTGAEISLQINLRSNLDYTNNQYYIILSTQEVEIPLRPTTLDAFVEPGEAPPAGSSSAEVYYQNYFSTWSGYLRNSAALVYLIKGPFISSTESYTLEHIIDLTSGTNKISLNFPLSRIFNGNPSKIYFDFVTTSATQSAEKYVKDHIDSARYISNYTTSIASGSDSADTTIDGSLDITSWQVEIE